MCKHTNYNKDVGVFIAVVPVEAVHAFLIPVFGRQKQAELYEFNASLVYMHSKFQNGQGYIDLNS